MGIVRATLQDLAKLLGVKESQLDVVKEEKSAKAALSRRGLFQAVGAVAAGTLFRESVLEGLHKPLFRQYLQSRLYSWSELHFQINGVPIIRFEIENIEYSPL